MFPLLRRRSTKKSKDGAPPSDPLPPIPGPRPLTSAGFQVPAVPLVHRQIRGLPISPPFTKVEFRHRTSPTSSTQRYRPIPTALANFSDETTLASPSSVHSPLSSASDHDLPQFATSPVEVASSYDKGSEQYYSAEDESGSEFVRIVRHNRVSCIPVNSSDSGDPQSPSTDPQSRASTGSSLDALPPTRRFLASQTPRKLSVYVDNDDVSQPPLPPPKPEPRPQRTVFTPKAAKVARPRTRVGILRWENDLDGCVGQQKLWIQIFEQDDADHMLMVESLPVMSSPVWQPKSRDDCLELTHISRPLPDSPSAPASPPQPTGFKKILSESLGAFLHKHDNVEAHLSSYQKELNYLGSLPIIRPTSRGPVRSIGLLSKFHNRQAVPRDTQPDFFEWKVTQRNVIGVKHSLEHKTWYTGSVLGQGTFGRVYLVYNVPHRVQMAMKVVYVKRPLSKIVCQGLVNELKAFERLTRPDAEDAVFVMTPCVATGLWAWYSSEGFLHITVPFCPGGDLFEYVGRLSHDQLRLIVAELALGLESLHCLGIVHHDLKPENVLIDEDGHCVIADYGGSKFLSDGILIRKPKDEVICTLPYAAPELLSPSSAKYKPYDEAIDYWALGATVYMLTTGEELFSGSTEEVMQKHLCVPNILHDRMRGCPEDLIDLCASLLHLDSQSRLRGPAVRSHPYFASFRHLWPDVTHKRLGSPIPFVRNVGGVARGFDPECKSWPSELVPDDAGNPKTAFLLDVLAKDGLELEVHESFDVQLQHSTLTIH